MRPKFALAWRIGVFKIVLKDVFYVGLFKLKTANLIQVTFTHVLVLFIVVVDSNLNVISAHGPDIKVLNIPKLAYKERRFTDLKFAIFIWGIDHFRTELYYGLVLGGYIVFFRPVFPQIPWIRPCGIFLHHDLPWYHIVIGDFALQFQFFNSIKNEVVAVVSLLVLIFGSDD